MSHSSKWPPRHIYTFNGDIIFVLPELLSGLGALNRSTIQICPKGVLHTCQFCCNWIESGQRYIGTPGWIGHVDCFMSYAIELDQHHPHRFVCLGAN